MLNDSSAGEIGELPSVRQWNEDFFGAAGSAGAIPKGKGLSGAVEVHHVVEKWIMRKLGLVETDEVPGAVLLKSVGQLDGHAALQGTLRREIFSVDDPNEIVTRIRAVYQGNPKWSNLWPAAEAWLRGQGFPIPN